MKSMLLATALLFWSLPSWANLSWGQQLRDIEARSKRQSDFVLKPAFRPSSYIKEFDRHGAFNRGPLSLKSIALTFDDGPGEETPAVLEVLAKHGAKATFFMIGEQVAAHPDYAKMVADAGHEIGNHTYSHRNFCTSDVTRASVPHLIIAEEINRAQTAIKQATGVTPKLARMPYACRSGWVEKTVERLGLSVVRWSVDGQDWEQPGTAQLVSYYLSHAEPGAVFLFHDGGGPDRTQTVEALDILLTRLKARGLTFITAGEMLHLTRTETAASAR